jgi:hypothetical protein
MIIPGIARLTLSVKNKFTTRCSAIVFALEPATKSTRKHDKAPGLTPHARRRRIKKKCSDNLFPTQPTLRMRGIYTNRCLSGNDAERNNALRAKDAAARNSFRMHPHHNACGERQGLCDAKNEIRRVQLCQMRTAFACTAKLFHKRRAVWK